ncbi:MAG: DegT/DnrJ/EryC1/StrS family aminotransferase [Deltaproteobacteria bacterium]|nr:DegT/DnrJ/EryC1/StrS family aminotransferase [Deltaproteobacteria bacterium]
MIQIKIPWAQPDIGEEELNEVVDSFRSGWLTMGPKVKTFEKGLSSFLNVPYALAVSNGTVALDLILKSMGIGPGDEVIVPAMTFFASTSTVSYQSAVPVFVDIDPQTFNLDPNCIAEAITKKTRAILFIDYGGNPADYDNLLKVSKRHGVPLIQDGAQSLGAVYKGRPVGAQAQVASMSFHMAKVMTTVEGGMIFCRKKSLWHDMLKRRNHGEPAGKKYTHAVLGTNARMSDIHAGIGLAQFNKLPLLIEKRKQVAKLYDHIFSSKKSKIQVSTTPYENSSNAYFFYPILIDQRDKISQRLLHEYGIDTRIAYPMPLWKQPVYRSSRLSFHKMKCPVAEYVTSKVLNLPIFPSMTTEMINYVGQAVLNEVERC